MGTCSRLATVMDQEMLEVAGGVPILPRATPDDRLEQRTGQAVAIELGGRYLLRYMLGHQVGEFVNGSSMRHCVTPTPYTGEETVPWLYLPAPTESRSFVLMLDPKKIPLILGPRWVRLGLGIEYILPSGFPKEAVVEGWELEVR